MLIDVLLNLAEFYLIFFAVKFIVEDYSILSVSIIFHLEAELKTCQWQCSQTWRKNADPLVSPENDKQVVVYCIEAEIVQIVLH